MGAGNGAARASMQGLDQRGVAIEHCDRTAECQRDKRGGKQDRACVWFAASLVPAYDPANWANDYERRAAAQQAERQRMAQYYERLTEEQEDRENAEARERFAASQRKNSV